VASHRLMRAGPRGWAAAQILMLVMDPPPETPPPPSKNWSVVGNGPERPAPRGFIHLSVAEKFYGVLQSLADPEAIIAEGGLDPRLFGSARNLVSMTVLGNFLHLCAERTNCPHIGLLIGQQATLDSLRLAGSLMRTSETVGDALRVIEAHLKVQYRGAAVRIEIEGGLAVLRLALCAPMGKEPARSVKEDWRRSCGPCANCAVLTGLPPRS
jgi:hypothetical protein